MGNILRLTKTHSSFKSEVSNSIENDREMMEAPCKSPCWCCLGCLCGCCMQMKVRKESLDGSLEHYICCQGYFPGCCCLKAGNCGESSCPCCCLCIEAFCCLSCSVSSNRMLVMDKYQVRPDPWDNRIIRFNNCLQLLSCICHIAAIFEPNLREAARIIDIIAELVFYTTWLTGILKVGCMTGQMMYEFNYQKSIAPQGIAMQR